MDATPRTLPPHTPRAVPSRHPPTPVTPHGALTSAGGGREGKRRQPEMISLESAAGTHGAPAARLGAGAAARRRGGPARAAPGGAAPKWPRPQEPRPKWPRPLLRAGGRL